MFYPNLIRSIKPADRVLEIGPGNTPFYRSDIYLEKIFSEEDLFRQSGRTRRREFKKEVVTYSGGKFPFDDFEFDYVIASHVLEHIPYCEVADFIAEVERVAPRGYIEVPLYTYELSRDIDVHELMINICGVNDVEVRICDKKSFFEISERKLILQLFKSAGADLLRVAPWYFVQGFEWESKINYNLVNSVEGLIPEGMGMQLNSFKGGFKGRFGSLANRHRFFQMLFNRFG
jgi:Methyltransferase domain